VATLGELQGKLALLDLRQGMSKLIVPFTVLGLAAVISLGCVPVALMALAFTLEATTTLSLPACFGIALLIGIVVAVALGISAYLSLKGGVRMFDRSLSECRRNMQWAKDTLKRIGQNNAGASSRPANGRW